MKLKISLLNKQLTLSLIKDDRTVDSSSWEENNTLSQKLLVEIDTLLKKNGLESSDLKKAEFETDLPEGYTSNRIIETVVKITNTANC